MNKMTKIRKYLESREKQYSQLKYDEYSDVTKLAENTDLGNKEIKRCHFLLKTMDEIEEIVKGNGD